MLLYARVWLCVGVSLRLVRLLLGFPSAHRGTLRQSTLSRGARTVGSWPAGAMTQLFACGMPPAAPVWRYWRCVLGRLCCGHLSTCALCGMRSEPVSPSHSVPYSSVRTARIHAQLSRRVWIALSSHALLCCNRALRDTQRTSTQ